MRIRLPEGKEKKEQEKIFKEIMMGKLPTLMKTINLYIQVAQQYLGRINT